jgi:NitT/TauT family transport system substrate-binding protein
MSQNRRAGATRICACGPRCGAGVARLASRENMEETMERVAPAALGMLALMLSAALAARADDKPEFAHVRLAVGGRSGLFYLPLTVTERLGYFKDAGLDVEIADVQAGVRALQAVVGGSAEVATGTFDHTIQMQAKNQPVVAVVQFGRIPGFVLGVMTSKAAAYRGPKDLKGMKIGVTAPGSSTQFMAAYLMVRNGLKPDDASFIGVGVTSTAVAAARRAEIDAIVSSDPMVSLMESENLIKVIADTRTPAGTRAVYGGLYPAGTLYATPGFVAQNPRTVQALVNAFVRGLKWISTHTAQDIAALMPQDYALGNAAVYVRAIAASQAMYSPDGRFSPEGAETALRVLREFDPAVAVATIDLAKTYTEIFVEKALAGN